MLYGWCSIIVVHDEGIDGDAHNFTFLSALAVAKTKTCSFPAKGTTTIISKTTKLHAG